MSVHTPSAPIFPIRRQCLRAVLAVALAVTLAAGCSDDDGASSSVIDVGQRGEGTCLDFPANTESEVTSLPTVACDQPHSHEIYAVHTITPDEQPAYPGFGELELQAQTVCLKAFEPYVGTNPFDSALFYSWLVPTLTSWDQHDDREIICVAGNGNGGQLLGTIKDSNR